MCPNYSHEQVCNWMLPAEEARRCAWRRVSIAVPATRARKQLQTRTLVRAERAKPLQSWPALWQRPSARRRRPGDQSTASST
ncbi:MAG: hypothetical protein ACREU4_12630, partial [Burkholderiales bacterium]